MVGLAVLGRQLFGAASFQTDWPTAVHFFMNRVRREGFIKHARTAAFDSSQLRGMVVEG